MIVKTNGITRIVFLTNKYAIKIPNPFNNHVNFLSGCYANWKERMYYKSWKQSQYYLKDLVVPTLYCSLFGLVSIQYKCEQLERELEEDEENTFLNVTEDTKSENFGYYDKVLVCLDYA